MIVESYSKLQDIGPEMEEKFMALFPTWTTVLATVLSVTILLLVLGKFVYKPIKKMVQERKNYIQSNIDEAVESNSNALLDREKANEELDHARLEASAIIAKAKYDAEIVKNDFVSKAKDEAGRIVSDAQLEAQKEKERFEVEAKDAIIDVALAAAKQVVEKEVDNKSNRKIIEDFIKSK